METGLYFYLFYYKESFSQHTQTHLQDAFDESLFKPSLENGIQASFSFTEEEFPQDIPLIVRFFKGSPMAQRFVIVPLKHGAIKNNEEAADYRARLREEAHEQLQTWFGSEYEESRFVHISSMAWLSVQADEFERTEVVCKMISRFLRHSGAAADERFKSLDTIEYVVNSGGLGVAARSVSQLRAKRLLLLFMLAKAYTISLAEISASAVKTLTRSSEDAQEGTVMIENKLEDINRFLVQYYFDEPIMPRHNEAFLIYDAVKKWFHIDNLYSETCEQMRLLTEVAHLRRNKINVEDSIRQRQLQLNFQTSQEQRQNRYIVLISIFAVVIIILQLILVFKV